MLPLSLMQKSQSRKESEYFPFWNNRNFTNYLVCRNGRYDFLLCGPLPSYERNQVYLYSLFLKCNEHLQNFHMCVIHSSKAFYQHSIQLTINYCNYCTCYLFYIICNNRRIFQPIVLHLDVRMCLSLYIPRNIERLSSICMESLVFLCTRCIFIPNSSQNFIYERVNLLSQSLRMRWFRCHFITS